jgi:hypothetical protein
LTEIYEVPSLKEEERQKQQCNTTYKSCLWVSLEEYEKRRHVDDLIVQGIAMGTITKQQVCVRGLESKLCNESEDTTYSDYDNETYRKQVVDTVLEEQRKQRLGGCKNDEEIASKCLEITTDCQQDAVRRGHRDSLDVHGQCCCCQQQQQQEESPSSNISTSSNTSSISASSSTTTTTPCDCCCLEDNEDGLVRNRHSMVVIQPLSKRRQKNKKTNNNKKSPKNLWKQMVKKTRRSFTNMTFSSNSGGNSSGIGSCS